VNRIDPDQDAVHRQQLVAHLIGEGFVIDGRLRFDAGSSERLEYADEAAALRGRVPTGGSVTARAQSGHPTLCAPADGHSKHWRIRRRSFRLQA